MIFIILLVIINNQLCQSRIFEIKEDDGKLKMETMNGFEIELFFELSLYISQLNLIQTSKCTQNCKDCTRRQCYLGNTELDYFEIKMYDLDTQSMVLQPLIYLNDQNQNHSSSLLSLSNPVHHINSFVNDGFQLCQSKTDKTFETSLQMNLKDIPLQKVLLSPILSKKSYTTQIQINYLKFGDTQIDISSHLIFLNLGQEQLFKFDPRFNDTQDELKFGKIQQNSEFNHFPDQVFSNLQSEFEKAGFNFINVEGKFILAGRGLNENSKYDLKFFNKENEEHPIILSPNQYVQEFDGWQMLKFVITKNIQSIVLGSSFFENKKVQFDFKENFVTIQNQFDERCFQYEKSTLYQQETLVLQVSIPLIILLALFLIKYQNNEASPEYQGEDPIKM
ncbi:unnamed protein product (macronuclear) [Paramecium tetraurelia]|uniref:Peptidase A1 domain-containing protein n=1 Tax=Paramecium tetraurelia TaxID=5888 RepID=A0D1S7_PARTE|nr:uncharacterized protein GSPATT00012519001 [Paramecium tetraurelia]CAK76994.1 unnamed protein product [Paramecium tetraurelia]|eukprot:XP_001444391.1 hypothetical protein (macronuclear) [Paramecium tetraurelia strain d4-2]